MGLSRLCHLGSSLIVRNCSMKNMVTKTILVIEISGPMFPTLELLSQTLQVSSATIECRLKEHNLTYLELKNRIRFERAQQILGDSEKRLDSISSELGFSDTSNFIKYFTSWSGMTPKNYRLLKKDLTLFYS